MDSTTLMAISPLDGRYQASLAPFRRFFSEYGLIQYRVAVEIAWLKLLAQEAKLPEIPPLSPAAIAHLDTITNHFSENDALRVKTIEATINHDVKSVEYFVKERLAELPELSKLTEFIHFGLTSEDVNNLAYALLFSTAKEEALLTTLNKLIAQLKTFAKQNASVAMLARTHGQSATPTTLGKELANVIARLERQMAQLTKQPLLGKLNGATGNYNALKVAYPEKDWPALSAQFITALGLEFNAYTTQIEPHDCLAELFAILARINTILLDFARDTWSYVAINYYQQVPNPNEVGSSTMPHKINPIDFENAEGNLGIANALFEHMMAKLPVSRWQRDLSDSTVLRNVGVAMGHSILAYQALMKGLKKLAPNVSVISEDLNNHWEVLGEAIQTVMRRYGVKEPYEQLKRFTRGRAINQSSLRQFIDGLDLPESIKIELRALTPSNYLGYAEQLTTDIE